MGRCSWVPIPPHSPSLSPWATPPPPDPNGDQQTGFPTGCREPGGDKHQANPSSAQGGCSALRGEASCAAHPVK